MAVSFSMEVRVVILAAFGLTLPLVVWAAGRLLRPLSRTLQALLADRSAST